MIHDDDPATTTMGEHSEPEDTNNSETESVLSIPLSSGPHSPKNLSFLHTPGYQSPVRTTPNFFEVPPSQPDTKDRADDTERSPQKDTDVFSETASMTAPSQRSNVFDTDVESSLTRDTSTSPTPVDQQSTSSRPDSYQIPVYPPIPLHLPNAEGSPNSIGRKARPESLLIEATEAVILGIALVDFNHLVGPQIEWSEGDIFKDPEVARILPFLALPDGAHLSAEDYSYFHVVPTQPNPKTMFGISCNRQIEADTLLVRDADVTRSIVQKAVVVLASKPIFGPIRDKLGVVTRAYFEQRDFSETSILSDFHSSLKHSVRTQLTESTLYIGTNLRGLVHTFRHRTLVLLKALIAQKKILFYGHPVEALCTLQYSLISLVPGLLHTLEDCGSPPLAARSKSLTPPNSLKTSDRKSLMTYLGLPLDIFGKDAFFQPYLPLQQLDLCKETSSWLCGTTNSIIMQQKDIDVLVNIEDKTLEIRDPYVSSIVSLTAADRVWIDEIVREVNEGWNELDPTRPRHMQFKGSEDYLRTKFEEYICAALSSIKYAQFLSKGEASKVIISDGPRNDATSWQLFHPAWIDALKKTNAYQVWDRVTDPMLFDIVEPRHPCSHKANVMSDIGLRLQEGINELHLEQQLAPTREAFNQAFTAGSTNFFKAVDTVRGRWTTSRRPSAASVVSDTGSSGTISPPVEVSRAEATGAEDESKKRDSATQSVPPIGVPRAMKDFAAPLSVVAGQAGSKVSSWSTGIGSFMSSSSKGWRLNMKKEIVPTTIQARTSDGSLSSISRVTTEATTQSVAVPSTVIVENENDPLKEPPSIDATTHDVNQM